MLQPSITHTRAAWTTAIVTAFNGGSKKHVCNLCVRMITRPVRVVQMEIKEERIKERRLKVDVPSHSR